MKRILILAIALAVSGCVAVATPRGLRVRPILPPLIIGPPVVVAPPAGIVVAPLPPVVEAPDSHVYFYNEFYYYNWEGGWYWSRTQHGPWHVLPRDRWPSHIDREEHERGEHHMRER